MRAYRCGLIVILAACAKEQPPAISVPPVSIPVQPAQPPPPPPPSPEEQARIENQRLAEEKLRQEEATREPPGDPTAPYTLASATRNLPGNGPIIATIKTTLGELTCNLFADRAPLSVANFIGLARGTRQWKASDGQWVQRPLYDGTIFHRVIQGFMIQGGDPKGNGSGEPGYAIPDEIWPGAKHDRAGLLCMANRGPNTNGAQFFITDGSAPHLDGMYTIFGECSPVSVVHTIASAPKTGERPNTPIVIESVTITR